MSLPCRHARPAFQIGPIFIGGAITRMAEVSFATQPIEGVAGIMKEFLFPARWYCEYTASLVLITLTVRLAEMPIRDGAYRTNNGMALAELRKSYENAVEYED